MQGQLSLMLLWKLFAVIYQLAVFKVCYNFRGWNKIFPYLPENWEVNIMEHGNSDNIYRSCLISTVQQCLIYVGYAQQCAVCTAHAVQCICQHMACTRQHKRTAHECYMRIYMHGMCNHLRNACRRQHMLNYIIQIGSVIQCSGV